MARKKKPCPEWARTLAPSSKHIIRNIVGRFSVGASDDAIRAEIRGKLQ